MCPDYTERMTMKTNELSGAALNWAVAQAEGLLAFGHRKISDDCVITLSTGEFEIFAPSTNWAQGGAIIEREDIGLISPHDDVNEWEAYHPTQVHNEYYGGTPLVAAMRCYVASKLGEDVEIPIEFLIARGV